MGTHCGPRRRKLDCSQRSPDARLGSSNPLGTPLARVPAEPLPIMVNDIAEAEPHLMRTVRCVCQFRHPGEGRNCLEAIIHFEGLTELRAADFGRSGPAPRFQSRTTAALSPSKLRGPRSRPDSRRNAASAVSAQQCSAPTTEDFGYAQLHLYDTAAGALRDVHRLVGGCIKLIGSLTVVGI